MLLMTYNWLSKSSPKLSTPNYLAETHSRPIRTSTASSQSDATSTHSRSSRTRTGPSFARIAGSSPTGRDASLLCLLQRKCLRPLPKDRARTSPTAAARGFGISQRQDCAEYPALPLLPPPLEFIGDQRIGNVGSEEWISHL